jgi:cytosine/adenosine deaminase-related metal-dependent hydrolase/ubiquinone/menaquinone biosynthesis C-methylase UbiE
MQNLLSCSGNPRLLPAREAYRLWAPTYDGEANPLLALEERVLGPLLLPAVAGRDVVDLGCGTGRWLPRVLAAGARSVTGLDQSAEMLARAAAKPDLRGRVVQADCADLPLRASSADLLICCFVLGYVSNLENFVRQITRVGRPGADLFISEFHPEASARGWRRSFSYERQVCQIQTFSHSLAKLCSLLTRSGFRLRHCAEPRFEEAERSIFMLRGKAALFEQVSKFPAALICHFRCDSESPRVRRHNAERNEQSGRHTLRLTGARVVLGPRETVSADVEIAGGRIASVNTRPTSRKSPEGRELNLDGYLLFPGLINSHDHLEFSLFPRLGNGPYRNFEKWAHDIYKPEEPPVWNHRQVPKGVRLWWGGVKNLLCGVTTVCQHNPYEAEFDNPAFPVRVLKPYGWAHSLTMGQDVAGAFRATPPDAPFFIHLGEGVDTRSRNEVFKLDRLGCLNRRTVLIHAVGLDAGGWSLVQERGASVVWCPSSNLFTLGRTMDVAVAEANGRVILGSDSPLTSAGDLLDELAFVRTKLAVRPEIIYEMVTSRPAEALGLQNGEGRISSGGIADLFALADLDRRATPAEALVHSSFAGVELVVLGGEVRLASPGMAGRGLPDSSNAFNKIHVDRSERYIRAPLQWLCSQAAPHVGRNLRLAGKQVRL